MNDYYNIATNLDSSDVMKQIAKQLRIANELKLVELSKDYLSEEAIKKMLLDIKRTI